MMRSTRLLAASVGLAIVVASGMLAALGSRGAGAAPDAGLRVGVVEVFELVEKAPQREQLEKQRRERMQAIDTWGMQADQEVKDLAGRVEREPRATRKELEQQWSRKKAMAKIELDLKMSDASQWYADSLEQLFAEIRAKIGEVARERGISMVFAKGNDKMSLERPGDFGLFVGMRPVLYADPALDITEAVKTKMNASRPPTPAAPPSSAPTPAAPPSPVPPVLPPVSPPGMR